MLEVRLGREAQGGQRQQESVRVSRVEPAWTLVGRHLHPLRVLELQRHEANEHRLGGGKGGGQGWVGEQVLRGHTPPHTRAAEAAVGRGAKLGRPPSRCGHRRGGRVP